MRIIKPGFAATSTSALSCGLGMFAYVKRYVPEAIIVLTTATFRNRIRGYIRFPQFSFRALQSVVQFPCTSSLQSVFVFVSVNFSLERWLLFCSYSVSYSLIAVVILLVFVFMLKVPYCVFFFSDSRLYNVIIMLLFC